MPPMPTGRADHGCGLVTTEARGPEIVVVGGIMTASRATLTFSLETGEWRTGTEVVDIHGAASLQLGETFLLVGGASVLPSTYLATILEYQPDSELWRVRPERLNTARGDAGVVLVEDWVVDCS